MFTQIKSTSLTFYSNWLSIEFTCYFSVWQVIHSPSTSCFLSHPLLCVRVWSLVWKGERDKQKEAETVAEEAALTGRRKLRDEKRQERKNSCIWSAIHLLFRWTLRLTLTTLLLLFFFFFFSFFAFTWPLLLFILFFSSFLSSLVRAMSHLQSHKVSKVAAHFHSPCEFFSPPSLLLRSKQFSCTQHFSLFYFLSLCQKASWVQSICVCSLLACATETFFRILSYEWPRWLVNLVSKLQEVFFKGHQHIPEPTLIHTTFSFFLFFFFLFLLSVSCSCCSSQSHALGTYVTPTWKTALCTNHKKQKFTPIHTLKHSHTCEPSLYLACRLQRWSHTSLALVSRHPSPSPSPPPLHPLAQLASPPPPPPLYIDPHSGTLWARGRKRTRESLPWKVKCDYDQSTFTSLEWSWKVAASKTLWHMRRDRLHLQSQYKLLQ